MPESIEVQIRAAVVAELNDVSRSWTGQFTAAESWLPNYTKGVLETLQVAVVCVDLEETKIDKTREQMDYGIAIDFQQQVDSEDIVLLNALSKLAQDVHDYFRKNGTSPRRLAALTDAIVMEAKRPDIYILARLYTDRVWETLIDLKVRIFR